MRLEKRSLADVLPGHRFCEDGRLTELGTLAENLLDPALGLSDDKIRAGVFVLADNSLHFISEKRLECIPFPAGASAQDIWDLAEDYLGSHSLARDTADALYVFVRSSEPLRDA